MKCWLCFPGQAGMLKTLQTIGPVDHSLFGGSVCEYMTGVIAWRVQIMANQGNLRRLLAVDPCRFKNSVCGTG